jgi:tRNA G18 (ribose-2'-O)-methylase SpoU
MKNKSSSHDHYLSGRHAIASCLQHHGNAGYYAKAICLWLYGGTKNHDDLAKQAKDIRVSIRLIQNIDEAPDSLRLELKSTHHVLTIEPIVPDLNQFDWEKAQTLLVVDHITDAQNLGAMIRSACALGVDAIFYPKHDQASLTSRVRFIAQGAAELIPCYRVPNINQWLKKAKDHGYWVYGFSEKGQEYLHNTNFHEKSVLVVGSEDRGIRAQTAEGCDYLIQIPTSSQFSCLNAASAASVILYERLRQRQLALVD